MCSWGHRPTVRLPFPVTCSWGHVSITSDSTPLFSAWMTSLPQFFINFHKMWSDCLSFLKRPGNLETSPCGLSISDLEVPSQPFNLMTFPSLLSTEVDWGKNGSSHKWHSACGLVKVTKPETRTALGCHLKDCEVPFTLGFWPSEIGKNIDLGTEKNSRTIKLWSAGEISQRYFSPDVKCEG